MDVSETCMYVYRSRTTVCKLTIIWNMTRSLSELSLYVSKEDGFHQNGSKLYHRILLQNTNGLWKSLHRSRPGKILNWIQVQQESIPIGCIPPACCSSPMFFPQGYDVIFYLVLGQVLVPGGGGGSCPRVGGGKYITFWQLRLRAVMMYHNKGVLSWCL